MFCLSNLIKESNRKTVISSFFLFYCNYQKINLPSASSASTKPCDEMCSLFRYGKVYIEPRFSLEKRKKKGKLFFAKGAAVSRSIQFLQGKKIELAYVM